MLIGVGHAALGQPVRETATTLVTEYATLSGDPTKLCSSLPELRAILLIIESLAKRYPDQVRPPTSLRSRTQASEAQCGTSTLASGDPLAYTVVVPGGGGAVSMERRVPGLLLAESYMTLEARAQFRKALGTTADSLTQWGTAHPEAMAALGKHGFGSKMPAGRESFELFVRSIEQLDGKPFDSAKLEKLKKIYGGIQARN
jgi:hypothetical protein